MKMKNYLIEQRLRIIKLLILIRYIYELQKSFAAERSEPAKNEAIQHDSKKARRLLAFGFEAGEGKARTMDKNGNTTQKGSWTYTYDYKNKIITATDGSKTISFEYDPFGRRISKSTGSNTTHYYYSGNQVIEERDGSDKLLKQYIYGNLIDEVLRMDKYNNNQIENSFYYHTDSIGNVTAITDKDGKIVERYKYNIYGSPTITDNTGNILSESAIGNDYLFQSRRYDPELHLYYYRARTYDPQIGRFLQTDPLGYRDSMNLYQAMNMNPWGFVDPWGERETCKQSEWQRSTVFDNPNNKGKLISWTIMEKWELVKRNQWGLIFIMVLLIMITLIKIRYLMNIGL